MTNSRRLYDACFHAAVVASQAFIAVVAGVAVAFALWSWPPPKVSRPRRLDQEIWELSGGELICGW